MGVSSASGSCSAPPSVISSPPLRASRSRRARSAGSSARRGSRASTRHGASAMPGPRSSMSAARASARGPGAEHGAAARAVDAAGARCVGAVFTQELAAIRRWCRRPARARREGSGPGRRRGGAGELASPASDPRRRDRRPAARRAPGRSARSAEARDLKRRLTSCPPVTPRSRRSA